MKATDSYFQEAQKEWDLMTLYADLASAKGKRLTPMEKLHLRGLLCGCSPAEIAETLGKDPNGVETDLSASIYRYVKALVGKKNLKLGNWRDICEFLAEEGYKYECFNDHDNNYNISDKNLLNITNIRFENNEIKIGVHLQISVPLATALSIQGLENLDNNNSDLN
jgi:hypothetical protein